MLLAREVDRALRLFQLLSMSESGGESTLRDHQHALSSVFRLDQSEPGVFECSFVEAWRDEVRVTVKTPRYDFVVGDAADENTGIGEQESSAGNEDSRDLSKQRAPIADMEHDVQRHRGIDRRTVERQGIIQIRLQDRR
jgi:hypothetical protein